MRTILAVAILLSTPAFAGGIVDPADHLRQVLDIRPLEGRPGCDSVNETQVEIVNNDPTYGYRIHVEARSQSPNTCTGGGPCEAVIDNVIVVGPGGQCGFTTMDMPTGVVCPPCTQPMGCPNPFCCAEGETNCTGCTNCNQASQNSSCDVCPDDCDDPSRYFCVDFKEVRVSVTDRQLPDGTWEPVNPFALGDPAVEVCHTHAPGPKGYGANYYPCPPPTNCCNSDTCPNIACN